MAHVAELDENNKVLRIIVVSNELEPNVEQFATQLFGGVWKQTSYNANFRGKYAAIGDTYDEIRDLFIVPKPFHSWLPNGSYWKAPKEAPGENYYWNEEKQDWFPIEPTDG